MTGSILIIKLGALGDLVQSVDVFYGIRRHHPGQRLILLTTRPFEGLVRPCPWFDEVWLDRRPKPWQLGAWVELARRLRGAGLARVYDLQCNQRTSWYYRLLAGPGRPEWSGAVAGCSHRRPDFLSLSGHNRDRLMAQIRSAGVAEAGPAPLDWLDAPVAHLGLPERFVLLIPGCSPHRPYKRWPPESYGALARRLEARGIAAVALGTRADQEAIAAVRAVAPAVIDLAGRTTLPEVAGIARRALGTVGNDTGPLFIAAAVGTPTLMLMSAHTIAERMAPLGPRVAWLQRQQLSELRVDEVEPALLNRLGSAGS